MSAFKTVICPIHKEGYLFIGIFAVVTFFATLLAKPLGIICFIATCWCIYFFRDPDRIIPTKEGLIVSPADGEIFSITESSLPPEIGDLSGDIYTKVSIFLNIFNVHVNRIPIAGKISFLHYFPGKFFNASLDKASTDNERQTCVVTTNDGQKIIFVQIAGLVARRIVCYLKQDQEVRTGERFGIIRFGSRVDVYLPKGANTLVAVGQKAIGGETILADLTSKEPARTGVKL